MAMALPDDGKLITMDISEKWTSVARRYWETAGLGHKIELALKDTKAAAIFSDRLRKEYPDSEQVRTLDNMERRNSG
mgnify:CR=1 FL=1